MTTKSYQKRELISLRLGHAKCPFIQKSEIEKLVKEMLVEGGADNVNLAYATLHYLFNPMVVKKMKQFLTSYKEDIQTLNIVDKVNLRVRDVMT